MMKIDSFYKWEGCGFWEVMYIDFKFLGGVSAGWGYGKLYTIY